MKLLKILFCNKLSSIVCAIFLLSAVNAVSFANKAQQLVIVPYDEAVNRTARDVFIAMLDEAKTSIDLMMYQLKDQPMINALVQAKKRGIKIRIIQESSPFKHALNKEENGLGGLKQLEELSVPIQTLAKRFWFSEENHIALAHSKVLIIDNERIAIMTCNWDKSSLDGTRDLGLVIDKQTNPEEVTDIVGIFAADWNNQEFDYKSKSLVVGPGHNLDRQSQRDEFIKLFSTAKKSIKIYTQSYNDEKTAKALEDICHKGIKVSLLMTPFPFGGSKDTSAVFQDRLINAGCEVQYMKRDPGLENDKLVANKMRAKNTTFYIHAKSFLVDDEKAYIGSCNYYAPSFEYTREIGIVTQDIGVINKLKNIFHRDWQLSAPKKIEL